MFEKIKCFILDMDGTSYLGNELFSFTKDFLKKVEETGENIISLRIILRKASKIILRNLKGLESGSKGSK